MMIRLFFLLALTWILAQPASLAIAQTSGTPSTSTSVSIPNPLPCDDATCLISQVIKYILGTIALIATFMFIWGGVMMMTAAGNEKRVEQAKETLAWALIGVVVILLSWTIIKYLLTILITRS